jgi:hypothetical protein
LLRQGIACGSPPGTTTEVQRVGFSFVENRFVSPKVSPKTPWPLLAIRHRRSKIDGPLCVSCEQKRVDNSLEPQPCHSFSPVLSQCCVAATGWCGPWTACPPATRRSSIPQHASDAGSPHSFPLHFLSPSPFSLVSYHARSREVAIVAAGEVVALPLPPSPRALSGGASGPDPHSCSAGPTST